MSDEKLEEMLKTVMNSEVPEDMQFKIPENESELKVVHFDRKKSVRRFAAGAVSLCAALALVLLPAQFINKNADNTGIDSSESGSKSQFEKYIEEYNYEIKNHEYEKILPSENGQEKEIFRFLGLLPEIREGYETEVFVRTVGFEEEKIYTRQAYVVWYDHNDEINALMPSSEKTESDISSSLFAGENGAQKVINNLLDSFGNRNRNVSFEGKLIRPELTEYPDVYDETVSKTVRCVINSGDTIIPLKVCSLNYTVNCSFFNENNPAPETSMEIFSRGGTTHYSTVLAYDCSRKNAVRMKSVNQDIWLEKAGRN